MALLFKNKTKHADFRLFFYEHNLSREKFYKFGSDLAFIWGIRTLEGMF